MIDFAPFLTTLQNAGLEKWSAQLANVLPKLMASDRHGDLAGWLDALNALPDLAATAIDLNRNSVRIAADTSLGAEQREALRQTLQQLHPWRKGPYDIFGVAIDTEWRSDWKWDRLKNQIAPLAGRKVLDVGCGSGYHCWRMRGAGADLVVGIDPTLLFVAQFFALQRYIRDDRVGVLPLGIEHLPGKLRFFDTVFSMGVLYHRRSPFDHLIELRDALRPGGQLVLETLVIDGNAGDILVPDNRYARMNNVWFIPSVATLSQWLKKVGFKNPQVINVTTTTTEEQRSTEWMTFQSLAQCLDSLDPTQTVEGYPAPKRAIISAEAP
ncbi:MAG: tRNA 5-methoxyuridine(34)/uridine 5-oxyacetic acid(34) synthase CmoB [Verrucomicrobiaceae bacterium]|nr:tRNA 5-methoxyuridine(34)/uridine 5-oxyacetic acid(34) synthase CmoB [Verrucomicrobiaceae bacterium]